jgi:signal transduction histidine kinase
MMDHHDFEQILTNIMLNAVQSMKGGGTLGISAQLSDSRVILEISDTGEGIEDEDIDKIFDPFYTTKQLGEGTGLGLWVTYEIVKHYGGEISVHSKRGEGTAFNISFKSAG